MAKIVVTRYNVSYSLSNSASYVAVYVPLRERCEQQRLHHHADNQSRTLRNNLSAQQTAAQQTAAQQTAEQQLAVQLTAKRTAKRAARRAERQDAVRRFTPASWLHTATANDNTLKQSGGCRGRRRIRHERSKQ